MCLTPRASERDDSQLTGQLHQPPAVRGQRQLVLKMGKHIVTVSVSNRSGGPANLSLVIPATQSFSCEAIQG